MPDGRSPLDLLEHHARDVARNDQDDIDELHQILKRHLDDLSPAQGEILVESFFEEGNAPTSRHAEA